MKNMEIEFKYKADISLTEFQKFCKSRKPEQFVIVSGYDHFYSKIDDLNSFYRHRVNLTENQLTFKRKTINDNNFIREEHNIDLPVSVLEEKISAMCGVHGYTYDCSIFKNCFIYNYDYYTLVYYICYDTNLMENDRFIEIEVKEDFGWSDEQEAYNELLILERLFKPLGLSTEKRLHASLFEMYRSKKK